MHLKIVSNKNASSEGTPPPPVALLYYLATLCQYADAHIRVLCNRHTYTLLIYVHILAANKFSPHSTITTFRTRQLKFLNGTFKSSHNRRQSRIAFATQCVSRHPSAGPSFCRTFPPLYVLCEISAWNGEQVNSISLRIATARVISIFDYIASYKIHRRKLHKAINLSVVT